MFGRVDGLVGDDAGDAWVLADDEKKRMLCLSGQQDHASLPEI
jgi:hypothetical protein